MNHPTKYAILLLILTGICTAEGVRIKSWIDGKPKGGAAVYPLSGQEIELAVDSIHGGFIRWYQIVPDCATWYKNANHPWEENPYKWVGFAKIDYDRRELIGHAGSWRIAPRFSDNAVASECYHTDKGSFWIQAEVIVGEDTLRSPGLDSRDHRGISPEVFRVSLRADTGYIGYLTSFFNVPGLFGSIPYQSWNYIGADCADILTAARAHWKGRELKKDYNVAMLVTSLESRTEFHVKKGKPSLDIVWNRDVSVGDFIAVRYKGSRQYQHIGALYKDVNEDSLLNPSDAILHAGPFSLKIGYLREGSFDGEVVILRP